MSFFALGVLLLLWLVLSLGKTEISNSPFSEDRLPLIEERLSESKKFEALFINYKNQAGSFSKEELEESNAKLNDCFSTTEQLSLGLLKVKKDLAAADYKWISLALISALIAHYFRALRWNLLINTMGYKPRSLITFLAVMIGYLANTAVPRAGEVSRCVALSKSENIPMDKLLGTVILERGIDLLCLLFMVILTFVLQLDIVLGFFQEVVFKGEEEMSFSKVLKSLGIIIGFVLIAFFAWKLGIYLLSKTKWFFKFKRLYVGFVLGLKTIKSLQNPKTFIIHTIVIWVCYFFMIHLCFPAFEPFAKYFYEPIVGLAVLVIGSLGMVAPVQGGIGAYHFCVQMCMSLYGESKELGLSFAFIGHTAQTLLVIVVGVVSVIFLPLVTKWLKKS